MRGLRGCVGAWVNIKFEWVKIKVAWVKMKFVWVKEDFKFESQIYIINPLSKELMNVLKIYIDQSSVIKNLDFFLLKFQKPLMNISGQGSN